MKKGYSIFFLILFLVVLLTGCKTYDKLSGYTLGQQQVQQATFGIGSLSVGTNIHTEFANVFVDDVLKGTVPHSKALLVTGLSPGDHVVKLTKNYYFDYQEILTIVAGQTKILTVTLTPKKDGGQPCSSNDDCKFEDCYETGDSDVPKRCRDWQGWIGQCQNSYCSLDKKQCGSNNYKCALHNFPEGFYCSGSGSDSACVRKKADGEPCSFPFGDVECKSNNCKVGFCRPVGAVTKSDGSSCTSDIECGSMNCVDTEKGRKCKGFYYWIGSCGSVKEGWGCSKEKSKTRCTQWGINKNVCGAGLFYCDLVEDNAVCTLKKHNGFPCEFSNECRSSICNSKNKRCGWQSGTTCNTNLHCESNNCVNGKCV